MNKTHISKKDRALLTIAAAQRMAGEGRTPSARQVRKAHTEAGCAVAKRGMVVRGGADSTDGMFEKVCSKLSGIGGETDGECGSFWDKIKSAVTSTASKAAPYAPIAAAVAIPTIAAVPIAQRIIAARKAADAQKNQQDPGTADAAPQAADGATDPGVQQISGWMLGEEDLGWMLGEDALGFEVISHPAKGYTYLFGDEEMGAEERMLLREGAG